MVAADWKEKTATIEFENTDFKAFAGNYYLSMEAPQLSGNTGQLAKPETCTNSDSWNCKYCNITKTCKALADNKNFAPPSRKQLSDEEIKILADEIFNYESGIDDDAFIFARAIEKAHGIGDL